MSTKTALAAAAPRLPLEEVLTRWGPGSYDWTWAQEFADLIRTQHRCLAALLDDVEAHGVREPVLLGDDGRVWDGHHRLLVTRVLGLPDVPVEYGWGSDPGEVVITVPTQAPPSPAEGPPSSLTTALTAELEVPEEDLASLSAAADWPATVAAHHGHCVLGRFNALTAWRHVWCDTCDEGLWDAHLSLPAQRRA